MAQELPYLPSYKNVGKLFEKIMVAKQPDAFTTRFLADTLGLKGTSDRSLISILKTLGFLDSTGKPSSTYPLLRNKAAAASAIATAVRKAYGPLFEANERANELSNPDLKGLVAQVTGADESQTTKVVGTFNALTKLADFKVMGGEKEEKQDTKDEQDSGADITKKGLHGRPDFHYNIQIHLPSNGTEETYLNIFNALRKTLL